MNELMTLTFYNISIPKNKNLSPNSLSTSNRSYQPIRPTGLYLIQLMLSLSLNTPPQSQLEVPLHLLQPILLFGSSCQVAFWPTLLDLSGSMLICSLGHFQLSSGAPRSIDSPTLASTPTIFSLVQHPHDSAIYPILLLLRLSPCLWLALALARPLRCSRPITPCRWFYHQFSPSSAAC